MVWTLVFNRLRAKIDSNMNIDKLERANILAKSLIPKVDELLAMSSNSYNGKLADALWGAITV